MGEIWGIILAAGESRRMGFPKMLLKFDGKTMIENVIFNISRSAVDDIIVVLGANRDLLTELLERSAVKYCYNNEYKKGMLSSVNCGFRNLPSEFEAALVFQGDQPLITEITINTLIRAYRSSGKGIVIPTYKKKRGHPLLIDCRYRKEIDKLDNNEGLRSLAGRFPEDVLEVETDDHGIIRDFDTYEEYLFEINQIH